MREIIKRIYLTLRQAVLGLLFRPKALSAIDPDKVDSILIIRLDRIGDLVQSIPAIKTIKKIFPKSRITMLSNRSTLALTNLIPEVDEAIVYHGFFPTLRQLKKKKFSLAVDLLLDYTLKTALLSRLAKPQVNVGLDLQSRGRIFNVSFRPSVELKSMSKNLMDLARFLAVLAGKKGNDFADIEPELVLSSAAREFSAKFYRDKGITESDSIIGIAPGAKFPSQCWKEENFAVLADKIADEYRAKIIILASGDEETRVKKVVASMKNKPVIALGLDLEQLAGVISKLKILVCNNSGPLHMAAALNVATASTMGPTVPYLWWPQGKNHIVIRRELACSPCNRAICERHECLESISVEEMEKAVEVLMARI
jgi:ADP-heptose:LPS heptosyltransferase